MSVRAMIKSRRGIAAWLSGLFIVTCASGTVFAQARCGSVQSAWEQVAAYVVGVPFGALGPRGNAVGAYLGLRGFESPGDMVKRCMEELMPPLPAVDDPSNYPIVEEEDDDESWWSGIFGDPHLVTHDRVYYDFHGAGDYLLLAHGDADVEIQIRFVRPGEPRVTVGRSLGVRVGDRVVTFYEASDDIAQAVRIDGEVVPFSVGGTFLDEDLHVQRFRNWLMVRFRNGLALSTADRLTNQIKIPAAWSGQVIGMLGNADGDPGNDVARRDGTAVDPRDIGTLYGGFLDDWLVDSDESLFTVPFDEETFGPIRPASVVTLDELPIDDVSSATEVCREVGLPAGPTLDGCIFDVALTGDSSWATSDNIGLASRPDVGIARGAEYSDAGLVTPGNPVTIEAASEARQLRWSLVEPGRGDWFIRNIDLGLEPENGGSVCAARWALLGEDESRLADGSLCIDVPNIDAGGAVALVADVPAGVSGSFLVGAVAGGENIVGELGGRLRYDGALQSPGEVDTYRFTTDSGSRVLLLDPVGSNACGIVWHIDQGDDEVFRGASCFDTDPIILTDGGEVAVSIEAGTSPGPYSVEIVRVPDPRTRILTFGETLDASIETPGEVEQFTFTAVAGDEVLFSDPRDINNDCDIVWRLLGPTDSDDAVTELFSGSACFDSEPLLITADGDFIVEVAGRRATTAPASLAVFQVPDPETGTLIFNEALDASIGTPGARVRFEFDANADDQLKLSDPSGDNNECNIVWRILGPDTDNDGATELVFEQPVCFDSDSINLPADGRYVLEVDGRQARTGAVTLVAERL